MAAEHRRRTGQSLAAEVIVSAMRAGDFDARRTYALFLDRLARGLAHVVNILDPEVIVLGGGLSEVDELYADLPTRIARFVFSDTFDTPVRKSQHGSSSGVQDVIAEGDKVAVRAWNSCLQESFLGIPSQGRCQEFSATFIFRIVGGQVHEIWRNADDLGRVLQLGARIEPAGATP